MPIAIALSAYGRCRSYYLTRSLFMHYFFFSFAAVCWLLLHVLFFHWHIVLRVIMQWQMEIENNNNNNRRHNGSE